MKQRGVSDDVGAGCASGLQRHGFLRIYTILPESINANQHLQPLQTSVNGKKLSNIEVFVIRQEEPICVPLHAQSFIWKYRHLCF